MTKQEQIRTDMIAAMKAKNKQKKDVLSYLLGQIKNVEIDKRKELTDDEVNVVIQKQIKQTEDVLKMLPDNRQDLIAENQFTLSVLKEYAPKLMDENEVRHELYVVCADNGWDVNALTKSDKGKIMGKLMPKVKGKADGNLVSKVVADYCK